MEKYGDSDARVYRLLFILRPSLTARPALWLGGVRAEMYIALNILDKLPLYY